MEEPRPSSPAINDPSRALQILATEHWSLLATRSMSWNEVFSRSGLYLTVLSSSVVALALVAQATGFDRRFVVFALVLLPVVFFIGVTTVIRVAQAGLEDFLWVTGMNRIRHAYLEIEPGLERYFVTSHFDDARGLLTTFGAPGRARFRVARVFVTTPGMLAVVNSVVAGVIGGVVVLAAGGSEALILVSGLAVFVLGLAALLAFVGRLIRERRAALTPEFPAAAPEV